MKIAVYTIALNEERFVKRWHDSVKEADYWLIADTGSTDKTVELATSLGIKAPSISVKPWRFDVARNTALALLPNDIDYCIVMDMDEILLPGWRKKLEKALKTKPTSVSHTFTFSFNPDGSPGMQFRASRVHARHGYVWKYPVHEIQLPDRIAPVDVWADIEMQHHPDQGKSRSQYLPLLEAATAESPEDSRLSFYYGRELFFHKKFLESKNEFLRFLSLPKSLWKAQRSDAMLYIARCSEEDDRVRFTDQAIAESPERREGYVEKAKFWYEKQSWGECYAMAMKALAITERPLEYFCEEEAWGWYPYDLAALSSYYLGNKEEAAIHGAKALEINPTDDRLLKNMEFYLA